MEFAVLIEILKNAFSVLAYFFNPKLREKRDRKADLKRFKDLEEAYAIALADRDPQKAAQIARQMAELRAEYTYVNRGK